MGSNTRGHFNSAAQVIHGTPHPPFQPFCTKIFTLLPQPTSAVGAQTSCWQVFHAKVPSLHPHNTPAHPQYSPYAPNTYTPILPLLPLFQWHHLW